MKLPPFELRRPASIAEALEELARLGSDARVLAGGQSLLPLLRYRIARPHVLLDINALRDLQELAAGADGMRIGALVRHSELEELAAEHRSPTAGLLRAHAREIAFRPIRTRGTAVGSLVHADPKGDWPLAFLALDAQIELASSRGKRRVPLRDFVVGPLDTLRAVDELATAVIVPDTPEVLAWGRSKLQHRAGEYAVCSAIALQRSPGWECWVGAAGDKPFSLPGAASMLAQAAPSRRAFIEAARAELAAFLPDAAFVEQHRHAVNLADAVARATQLES